MFRACFLSAAILAGWSVEARAQDRWQGFYGGLSFGGSRAEGDVDGISGLDFDEDGASIGVYGGYLFTRPGSGFVWGPEIALTGLNGDTQKTNDAGDVANFDESYLLSPRVRAGYATDAFFAYGTVGFGITAGGIKPDDEDGTNVTIGGLVGLGVELALSETWSTRFDATQTNLGGPEYDFGNGDQKTDLNVTSFSIGLSRKF